MRPWDFATRPWSGCTAAGGRRGPGCRVGRSHKSRGTITIPRWSGAAWCRRSWSPDERARRFGFGSWPLASFRQGTRDSRARLLAPVASTGRQALQRVGLDQREGRCGLYLLRHTWRVGCSSAAVRSSASEMSSVMRRPYTPHAFIQTALREWAYARCYRTSRQRAAHLMPWLHRYNLAAAAGQSQRGAAHGLHVFGC